MCKCALLEEVNTEDWYVEVHCFVYGYMQTEE
jgi:hypothetical protein